MNKIMDNIEVEINEEEIIYEIRKRGNIWKVFYPDEGGIQTKFPVYDKEGKLITIIWSGGDIGKLTESFVEHSNARDAIRYAKELGAEKIILIKTKERKKKEQV